MDALTHLLVPALVLLAVRVPPARVAAVAPLALLPDLDVLVPPHRVVFHNAFALVAVAAAAFALARARHSEHAAQWAGLAAFAYGSHLALDLPTGVALLWPVLHAAPFVSFQVFWDATAHALVPALDMGWLPAAPAPGVETTHVTPATPTLVRATSAWGAWTLGVLAPVAWLAFHPAADRLRRKLTGARAPASDAEVRA